MEELRSYAEALLAWLDGKPIQYLEVNSHWYDWDGPRDCLNTPEFNCEMWRVKPGKERWYRNYLDSAGRVCVANASYKHILENGDMKWVDEPKSVWADE